MLQSATVLPGSDAPAGSGLVSAPEGTRVRQQKAPREESGKVIEGGPGVHSLGHGSFILTGGKGVSEACEERGHDFLTRLIMMKKGGDFSNACEEQGWTQMTLVLNQCEF